MSLINKLIQEKTLKTPRIISAFKKIKRKDFMIPGTREEAETNYPLPIGHSQTISQPYTVGFMLELLQPKKGDKVLDALLYAVKFKGCSISNDEIDEIKKLG